MDVWHVWMKSPNVQFYVSVAKAMWYLIPHLSILLVIIPMGQAKLFYSCKSLTSQTIANTSLGFLVSFADKAV